MYTKSCNSVFTVQLRNHVASKFESYVSMYKKTIPKNYPKLTSKHKVVRFFGAN
jgi:hypothetical protein